MQRGKLLATALFAMAGIACGQGQAVITAELDVPDPDNDGQTMIRALSDMEVRLYPFDRDQIFDSLANAASTPEPLIPDSLLQARARVAELQGAWQTARTEWQTLRDNLQRISGELEGLNRAEARYVQLFNEFRDMEGRVGTAERRSEAAFTEFDELQRSIIAQSDEIRIQRETWAGDAYRDVGVVFDARQTELGRDVLYDTTTADGIAVFDVPAGEWWVNARHELPFDELYWNVPITVEGTDPMQFKLERANATVRPNM